MKITVYSTKTGSTTEIVTNATTWGQVRSTLMDNGIYTGDSMKAVVAESKTTLEHLEAVLPVEDFTLMLVPIKNKSGNDYEHDEIAELVEDASEDVDNAIVILENAMETLSELISRLGTVKSTHLSKLAESVIKGLER